MESDDVHLLRPFDIASGLYLNAGIVAALLDELLVGQFDCMLTNYKAPSGKFFFKCIHVTLSSP